MSSAHHWVTLFAAWTVLGVATRAAQYDSAFAAIAEILGSGARRAISMITLWGGLASTVFWPVGHALGQSMGWRATMVVYALLNLLICLPLHLALPRQRSERKAVPATAAQSRSSQGSTANHAPQAPTASLNERDRERAMLVFALVLAGYSFVFSALSAHLIVLLEGIGLAAAVAVGLSSIKGIAQVAARFLEMVGQRWLSAITIGVIALAMLAGSMLMLVLMPPDPLLLAIATIVYGAANGLTTIVRGAVPLALFGHAGFGGTLGRIAAPGLVTAAIAPLAVASIIELSGPRTALELLA
ncbi:MAG: MFS transporter, partial [Quisquiliibacterium sp.]